MVLILAASESCRGRSFEIRDGNNEFPVNSVPWTSDNGLIVLSTGCIKRCAPASDLGVKQPFRRILCGSRREYYMIYFMVVYFIIPFYKRKEVYDKFISAELVILLRS